MSVGKSAAYSLSAGSNHRIQEFTTDGTFITEWGTAGTGNGQFIDPFGIAFDSSGNVFVADQVNQRIQKFTSDGTFIKSWSISLNPTGIAIDSHDNVYVTVQFSHFIAKFTTDGVLIKSWGSQGTGNGQFEYPRGIAIDSSDNVYVTDLIPNTLNYRVQKFTSDGTFITSWGSLGGSQFTPNQFNGYGIAIDSANNVYVADTYNHRIQVFTLLSANVPPSHTSITSATDGNGNPVQNGASTVSTSITFQVTANAGTNTIAGFECSLDGSVFSTCATTTNPATISYNNLAAGQQQHTFAVRAVDSVGNKDPTPATFTWTILTPVQGISKLIQLVDSMNDNNINQGIKIGLAAPLNAAEGLLTFNNNNPYINRAACNILNSFIYQVNARVHVGQLTTSQGMQLTQLSPYSAKAIKTALGCI